MKRAAEHFKKVDPILYGAFIEVVGKNGKLKILTSKKSGSYFADLCEAIINQQLSAKVASTIFARFKKLYPKQRVTAKYTLTIPNDKIRAVGPSNSKVKFIKDLAKRIESGELRVENLSKMDNEEVSSELVKVKGIGPWTVEMFLMFSLGREDVFSKGDYGLKSAIKKLYDLKSMPTNRQLEKITSNWSPYRTYACMILWRSSEK